MSQDGDNVKGSGMTACKPVKSACFNMSKCVSVNECVVNKQDLSFIVNDTEVSSVLSVQGSVKCTFPAVKMGSLESLKEFCECSQGLKG